MGILPLYRLRMALLAVLTVALVATGWAHRVPEPPSDVLAFMAATGATAADLCGDVGGGTHADPLCQACQIAVGVDLPAASEAVVPLRLAVGEMALRPREAGVVARVLDLSHAPQGPPLV